MSPPEKPAEKEAAEDENGSKQPEPAASPAAPVGRMFAMAEPLDYLLMAVGSLAAMGHGLVLPGLFIVFGGMIKAFGKFQDNPEEMGKEIAHLSLFTFTLACTVIVTGTLQVGCWTYTGERQAVKLRSRLLQALLRQDVGYYDAESRTATVVAHISTDIAVIQDGTSDKLGHLVQHMTTFLAGTVVGFVYTWRLSLLTVATVPVMGMVGAVYNNVAISLGAKSQESFHRATGVVEQAVTQIRAVYAYVEEASAVKALAKALESTVKIGTQAGLAKGIGMGALTASLYFSYALLLWYGGVLVDNGQATGDHIIVAVFSIIFGGMSLGIAAPDFQAFGLARVAAYQIFEVLDRQPLVEEAKNARKLKKVTGLVEFHNVSFAYPVRPDSMVLRNLSLSIPAGKVMALVGGSGSGKSTVISLIERFYDPTAGDIFLDGVNTKDLKLKWLRHQMGLVSQEPALFATSIRENIAYGKDDASDEDIQSAAKAANAHAFLSHLPQGYDTQVGERGFQLSGGQRQRLAIARAILRNPTILLLDEATSALDTESERVVQQALDSLMLGRTTVVVAHRLSTIRNADAIAVMNLGKLVELGSHEELMARKDGVYKGMVSMQHNSTGRANARATRVAQSPAAHGRRSWVAPSPAQAHQAPRHSFAGTPSRHSFAAASPLPGFSPGNFMARLSPATYSYSPAASGAYAHHSYYSPARASTSSVADISSAFSPARMTPSHRSQMSRDSEMLEKPSRRYSGLQDDVEQQDAQQQQEEGVLGAALDPSMANNRSAVLLRLLKMTKPSWPYTLLGTLGSAIAGATMPLLIFFLFELTVAYFIPDKAKMKHEIRKWVFVYLGLGFASLLGNAMQHYGFGRVAEEVTQRLQVDTFRSMLGFEVAWYDQEDNNSGAVVSRFAADGAAIKAAVADRTAQVVQNGTAFAVAIVVGLFTEWRMVLLALGVLPFYLSGGITMIQSMAGFSGRLSRAHEQANQVAAEAINNFRTIVSFSAEAKVMQRFHHVLAGPSRKRLQRCARTGAVFGVSQFCLNASSALSLWFMSVLIRKGSTFLHSIQTYQSLAQTAYQVAEVVSVVPAIVHATNVLAAVFAVIDRRPGEVADQEEAPTGFLKKRKSGKKTLSEVRGHVQLTDVEFSYPTRPDVLVLRGLSLKIPAGRTMALVGESGSGKSSIIALIERFYEPTAGVISLDGRDMASLDVRWQRRHIGLVQQEPALFQMSIRENILYGCGGDEQGREKTEVEVVAAAKMANAHGFISVLPEGYDTAVGNRGVQLSGGQKQRIAIARAVLKAPKILLLDEATSALDVESEKLVQDALGQLMASGKHTTVLVAHRLSTVRNANAIAVLSEGVVDQMGTHDELVVNKSGTYARLVRAQTG